MSEEREFVERRTHKTLSEREGVGQETRREMFASLSDWGCGR